MATTFVRKCNTPNFESNKNALKLKISPHKNNFSKKWNAFNKNQNLINIYKQNIQVQLYTNT